MTTPTTPAANRLDRWVARIARHWLLLVNLFFFAYVSLPFVAPIFMKFGWTGPAQVVYTIYSPLCHQLGYRTWYLFGEQAHYPREVFQQVTGIDPNDIWAARAFLGTVEIGFKVASCQRDVAIYGAILLFGLVYALPGLRGKMKPLNWVAWFALGIVPIGLDGFSQLFSQYPYNIFPIFSWIPQRESTPELRSLTGALFGLANAWLALPYLEQSMREIRAEAEAKLAQVAGMRPGGSTGRGDQPGRGVG